ncbi:MAG: FtsK/SpoIIIE domain-containing protein [Pseudoscardovia radai]|nr:FtsK/SpoIIIE domain-containing protein [Pseudoscardovia radai]
MRHSAHTSRQPERPHRRRHGASASADGHGTAAVEPRSRRRRERSPQSLLISVSYLAPVFSQLAMAGMMIAMGNWWFLGFVVPGLIGSLASGAAMIMSMRRQEEPEADPLTAPSETPLPAVHDPPPEETLLFPGVKVARPQHAWRAVVHAWLLPPSFDAPIGVCAEGVFTLGLLRSGPHALVAGTTGSGKSILLEVWCLALACRNPPRRLNFVFLDFKGGAAFRELRRLPHCVGCVSDLDIAHAVRALRAMEDEMHRRERLVAEHGVATADELPDPPPRLIVVVDEFAALRQRIPDYVNRLISLASLGRSLGMNLIICTQSPQGQVTADMKANLNLNVCLRVRDAFQSGEMIGSPAAARISPREPGTAFASDGADLTMFRCAPCGCTPRLVDGCRRAARFLGMDGAARRLFSAPLPRRIDARGALRLGTAAAGTGQGAGCGHLLEVGVADDGIRLESFLLDMRANTAIIGASGRGKTTALLSVAEAAGRAGWRVEAGTGCWTWRLESPDGLVARLADDADALLDPLASGPLADDFRQALTSRDATVMFAVSSARHVRYPEQCTRRILFALADKSSNVMMGMPSQTASALTDDDVRTPGRAIVVDEAAYPVQFFASDARDGLPLPTAPGRSA